MLKDLGVKPYTSPCPFNDCHLRRKRQGGCDDGVHIAIELLDGAVLLFTVEIPEQPQLRP